MRHLRQYKKACLINLQEKLKYCYNNIVMRKVLVILLVLVFAFFAFSATKVTAKVISDEKGTVSITKTEVINDDLFIGAKSVEIDGTVNGDLYVGAETVRIDGIINGNLHIGASTVNLGGVVKGNAYIGAGQVNVSSSKIGGSLLVGSGSLNVDKDSSVGGSILAGVGTITLSSPVKRNVYIGAGSIYIDSIIDGEVRIGAGNISIGSNAKIAKDLYYSIGSRDSGEINISDAATIAGVIHKSDYKFANQKDIETAKKELPAVFKGIKFAAMIISFVGALIVGFLYFKLFEKHFSQSASLISKSFWRTLGIGFLVTITFIPGFIILLITVIGIPLAGLALLILLLYFCLAKIVVGMAFGNWVSQKLNWKMTPYGAFAFGLSIIYLIGLIHVIGFFSGIVVLWTGLGALTIRMFSRSN
jgi:hypothetical protein